MRIETRSCRSSFWKPVRSPRKKLRMQFHACSCQTRVNSGWRTNLFIMEIATRSHVSSSPECTRQRLPVPSHMTEVPKLEISWPEDSIVSIIKICNNRIDHLSIRMNITETLSNHIHCIYIALHCIIHALFELITRDAGFFIFKEWYLRMTFILK